MLKSPYLFAISVLLALFGWATFSTQARAEKGKLGLSFDLSPAKAKAVNAPPVSPNPPATEKTYKEVKTAQIPERSQFPMPAEKNYDILPVPAAPIPVSSTLAYFQAPLPPISTEMLEAAQPEAAQSRSGALEEIGLSFTPDAVAIGEYAQVDLDSSPKAANPSGPSSPSLDSAALSFDPTDLETALEALEIEAAPSISTADEDAPSLDKVSLEASGLDDWIFQNGSNSLVARTVGSAEGTRHWQGDRTTAYYGHTDPGNGVWNLGTFSYQHGASSPEEADEKQLRRLKLQGSQIEQQAAQLGIALSLEEKLNALDLANQAPLAALDRGGYIERLAQAYRMQMKGEAAILWARTYAYLDPDTRAWNAPGLGNNVHSISKDQERRIAAISKALEAFEPDEGSSDSLDNLQRPSPESTESTQAFGGRPLPISNLYESFQLPPKADLATAEAILTEKALEEVPEQELEPTSELAVAEAGSPLPEQLTAELAPSKQADKIGIAFSPTEELTATAQTESAESDEDSATQGSATAQSQTGSQTESQSAGIDIFSLSADVEDTDAQAEEKQVETGSKSQEIARTEAAITEPESDEATRQQQLKRLKESVLPRDEDPVETKASSASPERPLWRVETTIPAQN